MVGSNLHPIGYLVKQSDADNELATEAGFLDEVEIFCACLSDRLFLPLV